MLRYRLLHYYNLPKQYRAKINKAIQCYAIGYRGKTNTRQIIQNKIINEIDIAST